MFGLSAGKLVRPAGRGFRVLDKLIMVRPNPGLVRRHIKPFSGNVGSDCRHPFLHRVHSQTEAGVVSTTPDTHILYRSKKQALLFETLHQRKSSRQVEAIHGAAAIRCNEVKEHLILTYAKRVRPLNC